MTLDLTPEQTDLVRTLIEKELADVRVEIHHTDSFDFKRELKNREVLLTDLMKILGA